MNLNSVSSSSALTALTSLRATGTSTIDAQLSTDDSTSLSDPAELFKKLEALAKSDPAKFKEAASKIADKLTEEADAATDPHEKEMLTNLADKFTKAAETGDVSDLKPPEGRPPGGPPPGGGANGSSGETSSSTTTYDPADTNQDGTVSLQERLAYDAKQAAQSTEDSTALSTYKNVVHAAAEQKANTLFSSLNSIIDSVING